jgi:hypothetical protein
MGAAATMSQQWGVPQTSMKWGLAYQQAQASQGFFRQILTLHDLREFELS